jgi:ABC-type multidrug transport system ATPase subunit
MRISLSDAGKRFNRDWVFRHLSYAFESPHKYAITGPNGSGKSTLLQVLAGAIDASEGKVEWWLTGKKMDDANVYKQIGIAAPYLELVEEMTALEFLDFHRNFKPIINNYSSAAILQRLSLEKAGSKQIRYYSSGMRQRIKLAQAIFSDTQIVLLDEPCTNLDEPGYELYYSLIEEYCNNRLVIVSSNEKLEYSFCKDILNMNSFKVL